MTSAELDEIKKQLSELSTPVARCTYCDIPVYAITPTPHPVCLECWVLKSEYDRMTNED